MSCDYKCSVDPFAVRGLISSGWRKGKSFKCVSVEIRHCQDVEGRSTVSSCGDVVYPHYKCGNPYEICIYPRMKVNLHYDDPQYICIHSSLKSRDLHFSTIHPQLNM